MTKHRPDRASDILDTIEDFGREYGYPPTIRELMERVGLRSTSAVHYHLGQLERKGLLSRDPKHSRGLRVNRPHTVAPDAVLLMVLMDGGVGYLSGETQTAISAWYAQRRAS